MKERKNLLEKLQKEEIERKKRPALRWREEEDKLECEKWKMEATLCREIEWEMEQNKLEP